MVLLVSTLNGINYGDSSAKAYISAFHDLLVSIVFVLPPGFSAMNLE